MTDDMERPDLYVVARFLERLWREGRPIKKTTLQLGVRLNYNVYRKYLAWLLRKGLVEIVAGEDGERVRLTPEGERTYGTLVRWLQDTFGDVRF